MSSNSVSFIVLPQQLLLKSDVNFAEIVGATDSKNIDTMQNIKQNII
jgi:hypothetical protein